MYYLRSTAAADAIKFTLDKVNMQQPAQEGTLQEGIIEPSIVQSVAPLVLEAQQTIQYEDQPMLAYEQKRSDMACSLDNPDACEACGSWLKKSNKT